MKRRLAISDIHGCAKSLEALLFDKLKVGTNDELYFLGDYIDRGPDSKGVMDLLFDMLDKGYNLKLIRGNHEQMLLDSVKSISDMELWTLNGCDATLSSFGVFLTNEIPDKYLSFWDSLPNFIELDNFVLVHAGLNFDIPNPLDDLHSMLWVRNTVVLPEKIKNKKMIVGHTPKSYDDISKSISESKIIIDGGCCYSNRYNSLGKLVALNLDTMELQYQFNID